MAAAEGGDGARRRIGLGLALAVAASASSAAAGQASSRPSAAIAPGAVVRRSAAG